MTFSNRRIPSLFVIFAGLSLVSALPALAATESTAHKEIRTAAQHAEFAAKAKNADGVHLHLHHVINCLVGPNGDGFDIAAGDPCAKMGKGAMPDASGSQATEGLLDQSLSLARIGLRTEDYRSTQAVAVAARDLLELAEKQDAGQRK